MVITTIPNHPAPMYASTPTFAVSPKMAKDTVYMPSSVAARLLGPIVRMDKPAPRPAERTER